MHDLGRGPSAPFNAVDCAAIPLDRFEETAFGTAAGGYSQLSDADGGTLFLDELGSMPFETQSKFLRAIEIKQYQRVSEAAVQQVDLRVISAGTPDMQKGGCDETFRKDFLFRLNALVISLPSVADRGEDVLLLFRHYVERLSTIYDVVALELTPDDFAAQLSYHWSGDAREVQTWLNAASGRKDSVAGR